MIVLNEKKNDTNIIHIIIGPETEFQFNLNGQSIIDISEYIKELPRDEKFVILLNRCDSEEEVLRTLAFENGRAQFQKAMQDISNLQHQETNYPIAKNNKVKEKQTKCPKCGRPGNYKTIDGIIESCESCKQIDDNLEKVKIPPPPSIDEMRKLRENLLNEQKKKNQKKDSEDLDG